MVWRHRGLTALLVIVGLFDLRPVASSQDKNPPASACRSLLDRTLEQLGSAGATAESFDRSLTALQRMKQELGTACAAWVKQAGSGSGQCERAGGTWDATRDSCQKIDNKIEVFGGTIEQVHYCWNSAIYYKLADGTEIVWEPDQTNTFKRGVPQHVMEFVSGVTDKDYYCLAQKVPIIVWKAAHVKAMRYRPYMPDDENQLRSDHAQAQARTLDDSNRKIASLSEQIAAGPKDSALLAKRGTAYLQRADYVHAMADFNEAVRLQPSEAANWNNRCWGRAVANQELDKALDDVKEALRIKPNYTSVFDCRGLIDLRQGRYDEAVSDYDKVLGIHAALDENGGGSWDTATAWYGRGLAERQTHNEIASVLDFGAAQAVSPTIAEEFAGYGFRIPEASRQPAVDFEKPGAMNAIEMAPLFDGYLEAFYRALAKPNSAVRASKLVKDSLSGMWEAAALQPADFDTSKICRSSLPASGNPAQETLESLRCFLLELDQATKKFAPEQDSDKYRQMIRGAIYGLENSTP